MNLSLYRILVGFPLFCSTKVIWRYRIMPAITNMVVINNWLLSNRSTTSGDTVYMIYATIITADKSVRHELMNSRLYDFEALRDWIYHRCHLDLHTTSSKSNRMGVAQVRTRIGMGQLTHFTEHNLFCVPDAYCMGCAIIYQRPSDAQSKKLGKFIHHEKSSI